MQSSRQPQLMPLRSYNGRGEGIRHVHGNDGRWNGERRASGTGNGGTGRRRECRLCGAAARLGGGASDSEAYDDGWMIHCAATTATSWLIVGACIERVHVGVIK